MPSSAAEPARGRLARISSPFATRSPEARNASSVAPRASMDTFHPARSKASPIHAPMAPAPTIATEETIRQQYQQASHRRPLYRNMAAALHAKRSDVSSRYNLDLTVL